MGDQARSIDIEEDPTFQRHQLRVEWMGWVGMGLVLLAALLGLLGNGPLSTATAGDDGEPIRVRYERIDRKSNPTSLTVELRPEAATEGQARVTVARAWVDAVTIDGIVPEPDAVEVAPDHLVYTFDVQPGAGPAEVTFRFEYENWGRKSCEIGLDGGPAHAFDVFVFP